MERILVVDDDRGMQDVLDIMLSRAGYQVATADDGAAALEIIRKKKFDLVITDLKMPRVDGIELLKGVKETAPETAVILLTAFASGETALAAMREGAYDYVEKNFNVDDMLAIVRDAIDRKETARKEPALAPPQGQDARYFGTMVGRSKEMQKVYAL
ncbi:MAG: sigma-54-dependent transcriptional regulator, partial [Syntrophaceae bacterium]